jgi:hypothetical protein
VLCCRLGLVDQQHWRMCVFVVDLFAMPAGHCEGVCWGHNKNTLLVHDLCCDETVVAFGGRGQVAMDCVRLVGVVRASATCWWERSHAYLQCATLGWRQLSRYTFRCSTCVLCHLGSL